MTYRVKLHPNTVKFLERIPEDVADRIKAKLLEIREDPFRYLEHYDIDKRDRIYKR